ncbi:ROK family protein [Candidatus Woesearchaeota archaeon]|nr:ROK family protein [Candidatus Woesearchaeota archaeon]
MRKVLALDIGGTNTRIAVFKLDKKPVMLSKEENLTEDIKDISKYIKSFSDKKGVAADEIGIGFAGPVVGNQIKLTNSNFSINKEKLMKKLNTKKLVIVNDFHTIGVGIEFMPRKDIVVLNKSAFNNNIKLVIGPGTGLGKAYVINGITYPAEGGYTSLGIEDIHEYGVLDYLSKKYKGPVYYEDVVSGRGLIDIYDYLEIQSNIDFDMNIKSRIRNVPKKAEFITKHCDKDELCDLTLRMFTKFYARFARDSALHLISSHVYLCAGISASIINHLRAHFMNEFIRHRVYSSLLKKINVFVVLNPEAGLYGAAGLFLSKN